jgi:hypothetical protein
MSFVMQGIECHYNVYNFARRAVCSACGAFKALIYHRTVFGLTVAYEDGNRMNMDECPPHVLAKFAVLGSWGDPIHLWLISVQQQEDRRERGFV